VSEHQRSSRWLYRLWVGANAVLLIGAAALIMRPWDSGSESVVQVRPPVPTEAEHPGIHPALPSVPDREELLATPGIRFGLSSPDVPFAPSRLRKLTAAAGRAPSTVLVFSKWNEEFRPELTALAYEQGMFPIISWEPWAGDPDRPDQPDYALSRIVDGSFDDYITRFATALRDQRWPVGIRFAHEMNGHWYPWSERRSGNRRGDYVKAWRHVHRIFQQVGATNAIWIWSPNIIRAVPNVSLKALYPGDDHVDWVGVVGYAVAEERAAEVFDPTLTLLRDITDKPILITETGAQPSYHKADWIRDFFAWLPDQPDIVGFIWFEYDDHEGGNADWRFTATEATTEAFRDGLATLTLAPPPGR
jgi:hypothetical protein